MRRATVDGAPMMDDFVPALPVNSPRKLLSTGAIGADASRAA